MRGLIDCNEWKTNKRRDAQICGKLKESNYDGDCTSRHLGSRTYEISGRLIFVAHSVHINFLYISDLFLFYAVYGTTLRETPSRNLLYQCVLL
jgi:hypothetical protein